MRAAGAGQPRVYRDGQLTILVSQDEDDAGLVRWHLSISHPKRYPVWHEIRTARYKYLPADVFVAMLLPPLEEYVNLHENCFHLWEVRDEFHR